MVSIARFFADSSEEESHADQLAFRCFGTFFPIQVEDLGKVFSIFDTSAEMGGIMIHDDLFH